MTGASRAPEPSPLCVPPAIAGRGDLAGWTQTPLKLARSWFTPDVILLEREGKRLVLKDVSNRPLIVRLLWCRKSISRETEALRRLKDVEAAPELVATLDRDGFVMEWLDAHPLPARRLGEELGTGFFKALDEAVERMHARGVAHGDLRRRNILISSDRLPRLIDFETAVLDGRPGLRHFAFRYASRIDALTILKIQGRYFPEALSEEERTRLRQAPLSLRAGRFLRKRIYGPLSPKRMLPRLRRLRSLLFGGGPGPTS